ncbi:MAG: HD-GYP domain-containing protein [Cellulosilyticaceae bacterium]
MKEKKVLYGQCKAGDILSRHIVNSANGVILCKKGKALSEDTIEWLKNFIHSDIYVVGDGWSKVWHLDEEHVKNYQQQKYRVKDALESFRFSEAINYGAIQEVCRQFGDVFGQDHSAIMGCVNMVRSVDEYTYTHSLNVGMLAVVVGKWLKLPEEALKDLMMAGLLHDIGKYRVPDKILNKRGELTPAEKLVMRRHVNYGYDRIKELPGVSEGVKLAVLSHHERNDGKGYPRQLIGEEIPLYGKILAVVDVYDAMISERVYKQRETPFEVMGYMMREELGRLDPEILLTFLTNIANYYIGVEVLLSTGEQAKVVFLPQNCIYRPIVKVDENYIDLSQENDIRIVDIL